MSFSWSSHWEPSLLLLLGWITLLFFFYASIQWGENKPLEIWLPILLGGIFLVSCLTLTEAWYIHPKLSQETSLEVPQNFLEKHFQARLKGGEVTVSFITSNMLGIFLALSLLFLLGLLWELFDRTPRPKLTLALTSLLFLISLTALILTKSMGSFLALGVGLALFLLFLPGGRKQKFLLLGSLLLLGLLFLVFQFSSLRHSLYTRWVYAKASWSMIQKHFFFGVGVNNYHAHYAEHKIPETEELVRHAHFDYLQIFSELGLFGFLLYLFLLYMLCKVLLKSLFTTFTAKEFRRFWKAKAKLESLSPFFPLFLSGLFSFSLLYALGTTILSDLTLCLFFGFAWLAFVISYAFSLRKTHWQYKTSPKPYHYLQLGIFSAFSAFLFHSLGSYPLYSGGVLFLVTAFLALAFIIQRQRQEKKGYFLTLSFRSFSREFSFLLFCFLLLGLTFLVIQASLTSDIHVQQGDLLRAKGESEPKQEEKVKILEKALWEYKQGERFYPIEEKIPAIQGRTGEMLYHFSPKKEYLEIAEAAFQRAIQRAPRKTSLLYHLGLFYLRHPQLDPQLEKRKELFERCVEYFPTHPRYHFELGSLYLELVQRGKEEYQQKAYRALRRAKFYNAIVPKDFALLDSKGRRTEKPIEEALQRLYSLRKTRR